MNTTCVVKPQTSHIRPTLLIHPHPNPKEGSHRFLNWQGKDASTFGASFLYIRPDGTQGSRKGSVRMNSQAKGSVNTGKRLAIWGLYAASAVISLLGIAFCGYSLIYNVQIAVMRSTIPGAVFGAVIAFLGVRYFLAVGKLRKEVYRPTSRFSWGNFKRK